MQNLSPQLFPDGPSETGTVPIPHIIKYMGSKKPIIDIVTSELCNIHNTDLPICDLFAGSCSISAALRNKFDFVSNDIQRYSEVLAKTYFSDFSTIEIAKLLKQIELSSSEYAKLLMNDYKIMKTDFTKISSVQEFYEIEKEQRSLMSLSLTKRKYHLFTRFYSGTYWSFEQCIWIDALRKVAESYRNSAVYFAILSAIMYAMSYTSQSTGHFAQYRDGKTLKAVDDILIYRKKNILALFEKKFTALLQQLRGGHKSLTTYDLNFTECLKKLPERTTIYADPPYAPVHYSRFYHALETLVLYDYPELEFKGRYRKDRHQSPFSQKSKAISAFSDLFEGVRNIKSQLVLSYSNTGILQIEKICELAEQVFRKNYYTLEYKLFAHSHSSMGYDQKRKVLEFLIVAKRK